MSFFTSASPNRRPINRFVAYRVLAADSLRKGFNFCDTFDLLHNQYKLNREESYNICLRAHRGGGFTKDYLYLSGFVKILRMYLNDIDLSPLLVGKTSTDFYDTLVEMIDREIVKPPLYKTHSFTAPKYEPGHGLYDYILSGLQ